MRINLLDFVERLQLLMISVKGAGNKIERKFMLMNLECFKK